MRRNAKLLFGAFVLFATFSLLVLKGQFAGSPVNRWTLGAELSIPRAEACSVLLADGRMLVAGGQGRTGAVNSVELYGTNGNFTAGAPMLQARAGAACVGLHDGRVLVMGGNDGSNSLASAELFDPTQNTWSAVGDMTTARGGHRAVVTPWGSVLVVGGESNGTPSDVVEVFTPISGRFNKVGQLSSPRANYAMTAIANRQVLIAGGSGAAGVLNTIDIYNGSQETITPGGNMLVGRRNFAVSALLDGRVLITGGFGADGSVLASSEIYDPASGKSVDGPQLPVSRANHEAYTLPHNGRVILMGGTDGNVTLAGTDAFEPWTGKFARGASMSTPRLGQATALLRRGSLMVTGGRNVGGVLGGSETYGFATVATDLEDYHPGQVATITGTGWKSGEQVRLRVSAYPADEHNTEFTAAVNADGTGQFKFSGFNIDRSHLGMRFVLQASGSESEAQTFFTDGATAVKDVQFSVTSGIAPYATSITVSGFVDETANFCALPIGNVTIKDTRSVDGQTLVSAPGTVKTALGGGPPNCQGLVTETRDNSTNGFFSFTFNAPTWFLAPGDHNIQINYEGFGTALPSAVYTFPYNVANVATQFSTPQFTSPSIPVGGSSEISVALQVNGSTWTGEPSANVRFSAGSPASEVNASGSRACAPPLGCRIYFAQVPTNLAAGTYNYVAIANSVGNGYALPANSISSPLSVTAAPTTTWVPSPSVASPFAFGTAITLSSTVTVNSPGTGTPTGTVTFRDGTTDLGTFNLNGAGTATSGSITLSGGSHSITAQYNGAGAFQGSNSGAAAISVTPAGVTPAVTVSPAVPPAYSPGVPVFGQQVTFTATLAPVAGVIPTGTVRFRDQSTATTLGTVSVDGVLGTASLSVSNLGVGLHVIEASYTPGAPNGSSFTQTTVGTANYTVAAVEANFTFSQPSYTATRGSSLSVTVSSVPVQNVSPSGSVTLRVDNADVLTKNLTAGGTTFNYPVDATAGNHTFSIHYSGDTTFRQRPGPAGQTALPTPTLTVNGATTTTTISSNPLTPLTYGNSVTFTATVNSSGSGTPTGTVTFFLDNVAQPDVSLTGNFANFTPSTLAAGPHTVRARYNGDSNFALSNSSDFGAQVNAATSSVSVTSNAPANTIALGGAVTFTAQVTTNPAAAGSSGTVTFTENATPLSVLCTNVAVSGGQATCTVTYDGTGILNGGGHTITATFTATTPANVTGSSGTKSLQVTKANATFGSPSLSPSSTVTYNTATNLTFGITAASGAPTPTGSLSLYDGTTLVTSQNAVAGTQTFVLPNSLIQSVGTHTLSVNYAGDSNYSSATSVFSTSFIVNKATPTSTITLPASNVTYGSQVTINPVTINGTGGTGAAPTGTVTFTSGAITLGTVTLSGGTGILNFTATQLPQGSNTITAAYSGDANYAAIANALASPPNTITIIQNGTTTTVNSSQSTSAFGASVTFTATIAPAGGLAGTPTGTVNFFDGATQLNGAGVPIVSGQASFATSTLTPGPHTITAVYSGDTNFTTSTTANFSQTIGAASTTTHLSPSTNNAGLNTTVTYTVTVTPAQGAPSPATGTVTVQDAISNNVLCTIGSLTNGTGSCDVLYDGTGPDRNAGSHTLKAVYAPSPSTWAASTSSVVTIQVGKATITNITPTASSAGLQFTYGTRSDLSVVVTPANPTPAYSAGIVRFTNGAVLINNTPVTFAPNNVNPASINTGTGEARLAGVLLPAGDHQINGNFIGDANWGAPSAQPATLITVSKATPTVTIAVPAPPYNVTYGGTLTTGQVTVAPVGAGVNPTGTVTLSSGSFTLATGTLDANGQFTFSNVQLPQSLNANVAAQNLTVTYNGDTNYTTASTASNGLNVGPASTNVSVSSSTLSATYGNNVTFTATFTGPGTISGNVGFLVDGNSIPGCGSQVVTNGVATCTVAATSSNGLAVVTNPPGHQVSVTNYINDANHTLGTVTASAPFAVVVAPTITSLTASPNPTTPGTAVTLTATVTETAGIAALGGTVTFREGSNVLCNTVVLSPANQTTSASATCSFTPSTAGPYNLTATYSGDAITGTSTSAAVVLNVTKPVPTITLTSNAAAVPAQVNTFTSAYGAAVTFTATATVASGAPLPTGVIQFYDGGNTLGGAVAVAAGSPSGCNCVQASLAVPSGSLSVLSGGSHAITAQYIPGGDPNYSLGNSATQNPPQILTQLVTKQSVTYSDFQANYTLFTGAPVFGQQVTFSVKVNPTTGTGVPSGSIVFRDAGNQIGPVVTLDGAGVATIITSSQNVPSLLTGSHSQLTWSYLGDSNFNAAISSPYPALDIHAAPTRTLLSTFPSNTQYGQTITISANVCATTVNPNPTTACTGAPSPGLLGTITFFDNNSATPTVLGTSGPVDSGGNASIQITLQSPPLAAGVIGAHSITAHYNGAGGSPITDVNFAQSTSQPANLNVTKGATTTALVSSVATSVTGQSVVFTATVNAPSSYGAAPTGTVQFFDGGAQLGTAVALVSGGGTTATATLTVPATGINALSVGQHIIAASYSGDSNYLTSGTALTPPPCTGGTCAIVQTVDKAVTTTTLSPSINSSLVGQQVILAANVVVTPPGSGAPTGTVQFFNGTTSLGSANLVASGPTGSQTFTATLTVETLPQGSLQLTAVYSGDPSYLGSTSPVVTQAVNKPETTVTVTTNLHPSVYGQQVTFTTTITPKIPGSGVPTGTVQFFDGTSLLATVQLVGGQATYTSSLGVGLHDIAVKYSGDDKYQPMISPPIPQLVNKKPLSMFLSSSSINAVASQVIVFTAQLSPSPEPGMPYPGGQVAFYSGSDVIGVGNLVSGIASISTTLPAGLHNVKAVYSGDANYTDAQSNYQAQTVNVAPTNTQLSSSINPSVYGQQVTFTLTVGVPFPGTVPAAGQAQLYDNGVPYGNPVSANNGSFQITVPNFGPGTHNVYATFIGNGSFGTSTSPTLTQIVNKAPTTTTLAVVPSSSTSRQQVKMTAVVTVPSPGAGAPSGAVQFDNTTTGQTLGTAAIKMIGGVYTATITTDQLNQTGAPQIIVATYSGDANFATSSSNPNGQSVFGTQIALTGAASYFSSNFAPDQIASIFGDSLADTVLSAQSTPLPTALSGTTVEITDAAGVKRLAPLFFVSPGQINFVVPTNVAFGLATVTVTNGRGATASSIILVTRTAAGLFSANASGKDVASAQVIRVNSAGGQTLENVAVYDTASQLMVPVPIDMGASSDQLYLVLYGTGIRYNPGLSSVKATVNGINVPVQYAGAAPGFVGLDQVNLGPLPASLRGAGTVNVVVTVDGQAANTVTLTFR